MNPGEVQLPLKHKQLESSMRYLSMEVNDVLKILEKIRVRLEKETNPCKGCCSCPDKFYVDSRLKYVSILSGEVYSY